MTDEKRRWSDLTRTQRHAILTAGAAELALTTYALVDLARRDPAQVRGRRSLWPLAFVVQPFGPLAYLRWGRRR
ncbi:MAG: PLDc N-terminal domain-containing protein [Nocardioides sp.]